MRLVNNDGVVGIEEFITLRFRQQNTIGHEFDIGGLCQFIVKTHLIADDFTQRAVQFLRNT